MFTGIVRGVGEVAKADVREDAASLWIRSPILDDAGAGASVAVDGVCLTITEIEGDVCRFDVTRETISRTALRERLVGDRVNLERPLRAGEELGGHIVQGHVDGVGRVEGVTEEGPSKRVRIRTPAGLDRYLVEKGSVTVDGVSLTVTAVDATGFEVALVPHTLEATTLGEAAPGRKVNLEVDVLAKYVEKLLAPWTGTGGPGAGEDDAGYL